MNWGIKQADYVGLHETLQSSAWPLFKFREFYNWTELIEKPPQNDAETTSITYKQNETTWRIWRKVTTPQANSHDAGWFIGWLEPNAGKMKYYHRLQVPETKLRQSHYDACSLVTLGDILSDICHFPPWPFLIHVTGIIHTVLFRTKIIIPFNGLCFANSPLKIPHWWRQLHWNNYACANKALEFYHLEILQSLESTSLLHEVFVC